MRIRLTELNPEPEWHLIAFREIAAETESIVHYRQNTIGDSSASDLAPILWPLTSRQACSTLTTLQRKRYLFVCINRRGADNPKGCCAAKDSEGIYKALKEEIAARGLAKLEARVCTSSCLDQCDTGVTVLVEPDHFFYGRVTAADVPEIVDGLVKGRPIKRLVVTADQHEA